MIIRIELGKDVPVWSELAGLIDTAKQNSVGLRRKVSARFFHLEETTMLPVAFEGIENFGFNHLPGRCRSIALETVRGEVEFECEVKDLKRRMARNTPNRLTIDDLVSRPDVLHAEIHALLLLQRQEATKPTRKNMNALWVSAAPCMACAQSLAYLSDLKFLFIDDGYRNFEGLEYLMTSLKDIRVFKVVRNDRTFDHLIEVTSPCEFKRICEHDPNVLLNVPKHHTTTSGM